MKKVGILALQGDFAAHEAAVVRAGGAALLVRAARQFGEIDGLIIPGGESSTMLRLLHYDNLMQPLAQFAREKQVFGTCAGVILLAKTVTSPAQESLAAMDVDVERNAYGRQNESRIVAIEPEADMGADKFEAVFIRAPIIRRAGASVKILARYNGDPVLVEQGLHMGATFHPELTTDTRVHARFLAKL
ncbi:MAG: pyridoxal 5'-phosphate synthase glutaminase subunit PdxT [Alphaproteobacteria bacterium]|nr:pyridoxal 5'-phosphate synthase glutaminase subunit PdxT [Alphaproteobacteria bacterium]